MKVFILLFSTFIISGCYIKIIDSTNSEDALLILSEDYFAASSVDFEEYKSIPFLFQEWKHSREEEKNSIKIYRPSASKIFPQVDFER